MWRFGLIAFVVGAVTALTVLTLPDPDPSDHTAIAVIAGVLALSAGVLALVGPDSRLGYLTPFWGVLCVSALVVFARPLGAMPLFYLWPLMQAAYFLDRRPLIAVEATMLVSYAVALQWSPPGQRTAYFLAVVGLHAARGGRGQPPAAARRTAGGQPGRRRQHGSPHRAAQPACLRGRVRDRAGACRPLPAAADAGRVRPGPLQVGERPLRPRRGGHGAVPDGCHARPWPARVRRGRAPGRRGVRHPVRGYRRARRPRGRGADRRRAGPGP